METNERHLKITGKLEIETDLEYGQVLPVVVTVVKKEEFDNQDGKVNKTFTGKLTQIVGHNA